MTKMQTKDKYMKLMNGMEVIESRYCITVKYFYCFFLLFLFEVLSPKREIMQLYSA